MIIDIHTHCFPDNLAPRAISTLANKANIQPYTDGTINGLKINEDCRNKYSFIQPIATKPEQTTGINKWAMSPKMKI